MVCLYVCVCVCMYTVMKVHVFVLGLCCHGNMHVAVCLYPHWNVCVFIVCISTCYCVSECVCVCVCACVCVCCEGGEHAGAHPVINLVFLSLPLPLSLSISPFWNEDAWGLE